MIETGIDPCILQNNVLYFGTLNQRCVKERVVTGRKYADEKGFGYSDRGLYAGPQPDGLRRFRFFRRGGLVRFCRHRFRWRQGVSGGRAAADGARSAGCRHTGIPGRLEGGAGRPGGDHSPECAERFQYLHNDRNQLCFQRGGSDYGQCHQRLAGSGGRYRYDSHSGHLDHGVRRGSEPV